MSSSLPPHLSPEDIASLLDRVDAEISSAQEELDHAQPIAQAAGLTVHSNVLDATYNRDGAFAASSSAAAGGDSAAAASESTATAATGPVDLQREAALAMQARQNYNPLRGTLSAFPLVLATTAGHSNTDHIVHQNPDGTIDKFREYKRRMKRRFLQTQLEERGTDRWDLPRIPGGRRRRIKRDADAPSAPPEPPTTGYVIYVSQMTTKLRHDNPNRPHNQITAVRRISSMWNNMPLKEREHYVKLAKDARNEYEERLMEYRATGQWAPFSTIGRLDNNKNSMITRTAVERNAGGNGPWVRIPFEQKNELERELDSYEMVIFPPRPAGTEEEHEKKMKDSQERRMKKIKEEGLKYY
ncbi:hypothetical protein ACHAXR_007037 [Thalassiosira sp. AJA248-18]